MMYIYIEISIVFGLIFALVFLLACAKDTHLSIKILGPVFCIFAGILWLPIIFAVLIYLVYKYIREIRFL